MWWKVTLKSVFKQVSDESSKKVIVVSLIISILNNTFGGSILKREHWVYTFVS